VNPVNEEITSALIPLRDRTLLVPGSAVAEISVWRRIRMVAGQPPWLLGLAQWRDGRLPVLDLEALMDPNRLPLDRGRCLVVLNRSRPEPDLSFVGLVGAGLPRLVRVAPDDLHGYRAEPSPWFLGRAVLGMDEVYFPDLTEIENQLLRLELPAPART
jgi:chemosensory pili system protein ChpC